jgi:hypothetical protein
MIFNVLDQIHGDPGAGFSTLIAGAAVMRRHGGMLRWSG